MTQRGAQGSARSGVVGAAVAALVVALALAVSTACSTAYGDGSVVDVENEAGCAVDCGAHGTCTVANGSMTCACRDGHVGPDCNACAPGFEAPGGGPCVSKCAAAPCGPHATCTVQGEAAACSCVTGYAKTQDGACAWSGGPQDPAFQDMPAGAWKLEGGLSIDPAAAGAPGQLSPGLARFSDDCTAAQVASQTFAMPTFSDAEPLALTISSTCDGKGFATCTSGVYQLGLNGRFVTGPPTKGYVRQTVCLGERAYGGDLLLRLEGTCASAGPFGGSAKALDDVKLAPAPTCPSPGTIGNPDFEASGGWTASAAGAEIAVGAGTAGSRAGHLSATTVCGSARLTGAISMPASSKQNPALSLSVRGTAQGVMTVLASGRTVAEIRGTGVFEAAKVCLPQWGRGLAHALDFAVSGPSSGTCGQAAPAVDFIFDDLAIVSDPACAEPGSVVDGGFESGGTSRPWIAFLQDGATFGYVTGSAHGGTSYGRLQAGATCAYSSLSQNVTVPDAKTGAGGPQLRLFYRTTSPTAATLLVAGATLPPANGWAPFTRCLDPKLAGHAMPLLASVQSADAGCAYAGLSLDDVDIVNDPACPE